MGTSVKLSKIKFRAYRYGWKAGAGTHDYIQKIQEARNAMGEDFICPDVLTYYDKGYARGQREFRLEMLLARADLGLSPPAILRPADMLPSGKRSWGKPQVLFSIGE